jgi:hypothetical protein
VKAPVPPTLQNVSQQKRTFRKIILFVIFLGALLWLLIPIAIGVSMIRQLFEMGRLDFTSYTDTFQVKILEVKSQPNYFEERIRVQCQRNMNASISVYDLKETGIFETNAPNGEIIYRESHPQKIGQSAPVSAKGEFSTCEIFFRVNTTATNTIWHGEDAGGTLDTSLPSPMTVNEVKTNWPDSYQRGSMIPLANLGEYKILLSIK